MLLIYDIESDKLRTKASDICLDYGLERIQFSAFFGKLNRSRRQELALKLRRLVGKANARIRIIPVCESDSKDMWVFDQFHRDAEELKREAEKAPVLRVLRQED